MSTGRVNHKTALVTGRVRASVVQRRSDESAHLTGAELVIAQGHAG
jgi:hypothetical protein